MSLGIHESQSRMLENYIGRSYHFWAQNYPALQALFPEQLKHIDLDEFVKQVNISKPTLIRTDADELTYPIHILIRYEIEKALFNEDLSLDQLDQVWADKYEEYLGIRPSNASDGILQDMHWSEAIFGYFPTYALGTAFSAQFYQQMKKDLDIDDLLMNHRFDVIAKWLHDHIHKYGSFLRSDALLMKVTGESFNPQYYIDYLIEK
ncbi:MAG: carboxypeptidase M32, partial [Erysipelotrichaceae bacterium]